MGEKLEAMKAAANKPLDQARISNILGSTMQPAEADVVWHRERGAKGRFHCIGEQLTWQAASEIIATRSGDYQVRFAEREVQQQRLPLCG